MIDPQRALRFTRIVHGIYLAEAVFDILLPFQLHPQEHSLLPMLPVVFAVVCVADLGIACYFRLRVIAPAQEILRTDPENEQALGRWRGGVIVSLTLCLSIVLFGFTLKFLGATWSVAGVFYAVGILLMLAWTPRLDVPTGS